MSRTCSTCAKLGKYGQCKVLVERIGMFEGCWAWTDDPYWEISVKSNVQKYKESLYERGEIEKVG